MTWRPPNENWHRQDIWSMLSIHEVMYPGTLGAIATGGANIFVEGSLIPSFAEEFLAQPKPNPLTRMMQIEPAMTPQDMQTIAV